jgi:hypothetical protein
VGSNVQGWARALATGSWDGWISLRGTNYGVGLSGTTFSGFAWGGNVIGWLSFNCTDGGTCATASYSVILTGDASLDVKSGGVTIVGNPAVPYGTAPTFEWTLTNIPSATCSVTKTAGGTTFAPINGITSSGSSVGNSLTTTGGASHTYSIDCTNPTISKQVSFTVAPQPAGFSLGSADTAKIQFLASGAADSQIKTIFVSPSGGFSNPVTISVTGVSPAPPGGTNFTYSLGGSAFMANPPAVILTNPYSTGTTIQVRVSKEITAPYSVTLTGTASGYPNSIKTIIVDPTSFDPTFEER